MSNSAIDNTPFNELGWYGVDRDSSQVETLAQHLQANNGLQGLECVEPDDIELARQLFYRDGFVVVRDVLSAAQLTELRRGVEREVRAILDMDTRKAGNRGSHRYSFGSASLTGHMMHRAEWTMLLDLPGLTPIITAIFDSSDYHARGGGGDFCLPGAIEYQPLHSDMGDRRIHITPSGKRFNLGTFHDPRGLLNYRDLPVPCIACNFLTVDATSLNGPTRQIPGTQHSHEPMPSLLDEPEWMRLSTVCPASAGSVLIRDIRAWHGGTPNVSNEVRAIPNVEFFAPWFIEPQQRSVPRDIYAGLSSHAQHLCRYIVAEPGTELRLGYRDRFDGSPF